MSGSLPTTIALTDIGGSITSAPHDTNYGAVQTAVNALIAALGITAKGDILAATASGALANLAVGGNAMALVADSTQATGLGWGPTYTTYTPTWTATGVAPAIGNAVVIGRYSQVGKLVHCYGTVTFGTTSTFGTGNYKFALPVTAAANAANAFITGTAMLFDSSAGVEGLAVCRFATATTTMQIEYGATYLGVATAVGQTTPWTWAQSDVIAWNLIYEAA